MSVGYITIALSYVGAFVGAGFISGQELAQFFLKFGVWGLLIWISTGLTISIGGGVLLGFISAEKPESFKELVEKNFDRRMVSLINLIINGYLVGGLIIMLSGAGCLISELTGLPLSISVTIVAFLIFLTIIGKGERILKVNGILVPVLIVSTFGIALYLTLNGLSTYRWNSVFVIKNPSPLLINPLVSYFLYIGYNAIGAIVALVNISRESDSENCRKGGFLGGVLITVLGSLLIATMWISYPVWQSADMPITFILRKNFMGIYYLFVPSILIAMFTVATAYSLGISKYIQAEYKFDFKKICGLVLVVTAPVAFLGFSKLLGIVYPIFGILATLIIIFLIIRAIYVRIHIYASHHK